MDDARLTLAGRYELVEVIGRGGMGTVYRAVDLVLGRSVAVKLLPGLLADEDPTSVARFEREARAAAALNHPAVVAVYDTGTDGATRFIVMEFVAGRSLEAVLREEGPLDPDRAAGIAERVADALAAAHAAGIVHRDIKPANVMLTEDGSVKVLDFGIARASDATALTQDAEVLGTASYMAPEQAVGTSADERSDIYSLGCVLYALLTGHPPFTGESAAAILHQHANIAPRPLRAHNGRVSPALDTLVMQMLAKAPDERPQSATEIRARLTAAASGLPATRAVTARTARLRQTPATQPPPGVVHRIHRRLTLAAAAAALAAVITVIALTSADGSPPHPAPGARHGATGTTGTTASKATTSQTRSHTTTASSRSTTSTTTSTSTSSTASSTTAPQLTVAGTSGALTALATQDVEAGTIDQPAAQRLANALSDVLNSFEMGHAPDVQHKLAALTQQVTMLEQQGHITATATSALNTAVANLDTALTNTAPPTTTTTAPQPPDHPAHGREPPRQAKQAGKHGT